MGRRLIFIVQFAYITPILSTDDGRFRSKKVKVLHSMMVMVNQYQYTCLVLRRHLNICAAERR